MATFDLKMRPKNILIANGGEWSEKDRTYIGTEEELIPIPPTGPIFTDLLSRIQIRIMKPKSKYVYKVVALVESATGRTARMKIADDFELAYVLNELEAPILYVSTAPINEELLEAVNDHAERLANGTTPVTNASAQVGKIGLGRGLGKNLDTNLNTALDKDLNPDLERDLDRNMCKDRDMDIDRNIDRDLGGNFDMGLEWNEDWGFHDSDHDSEGEHDTEGDHDTSVASVQHTIDDVDNLENIPIGNTRPNVASVGSRNDAFEGDREYVGLWSIPGASFDMKQPKTQENIGNEGIGDDTLCKDAVFSSKDKLVTVLGLFHLANHVSFDTPRSCLKRYAAYCKSKKENCSFVCRAIALGEAWVIQEWAPHTCQKDLRFHSEPTICSKVLGAYFVPNLMTKGVVLRPSDIQSMVKKRFGAKIQYQTALAARNHALTMVYGDSNDSFKMLPKYLWMIESTNPGSVTEIKVDETGGRFQYCFMALGACIRGFKTCRPVIVVDGTHLKGKYKGVLLVAVTKDANEQVFPLAFGLADKETDESWTWFFQQLRGSFGCPDQFMIVSDQHASIKNAMDAVYPGVPHGLCIYHLQKNIKFWEDHAIALFQAAAHAYRARDFDTAINNLKARAPAAYNKVMSVDPSQWARSKTPVRRYLFSTSNAAECFNGCLRWARTLPVCTLLECIRSLIGQWFVERRALSISRTHELTEFGQNKLGRSAELGSTMSVEAISLTKFKVSASMTHHVVDLERKQCTCLIFDVDLIPCSHASAALRHTKQSPIPIVTSYYSTESLREIYAGEVMPVPMPEDWNVPVAVASWVVGAPLNPKQAGRPRVRRVRPVSESSSRRSGTMRCTRCGQLGHYQNTCHVPITISVSSVGEATSTGTKRRRPKTCGICKATGHTRTTCIHRVPPPP